MVFLSRILILSIFLSGCVGLSIEKTLPKDAKENYLIGKNNVTFSKNAKIGLLLTSYDFIKQQTQSYFLTERDTPERIYLDYHYGKEAVVFDKFLREKIQLFFNKMYSMDVMDLKENNKFLNFVQSDSQQLADIITWIRLNTDIEYLLVFHYSLGEKGEVIASRIEPLYIPGGNYTLYSATYETKIVKFSAFTFQAAVFDIQRNERVIAYNFPVFVNPDAAVDVFSTRTQHIKPNIKLFNEVLLETLFLNK